MTEERFQEICDKHLAEKGELTLEEEQDAYDWWLVHHSQENYRHPNG